MFKTTIAPRILANSDAAAVGGTNLDRSWTVKQLEPLMFGIRGGLSASGGDFGFEILEEQEAPVPAAAE